MIEKQFENLLYCLGNMDNKGGDGMKLQQAYDFVQELEQLTDALWVARKGSADTALERLSKLFGLPIGND